MKAILGLALLLSVAACGDANTDNENENADSIMETDPAIMQPPADALPDSMRLLKDSVIITDSTAGSLRDGTRHDTL